MAEKNQPRTLYQVECEPACGFLIRDHDQDEIVAVVAPHAKKFHGMNATTVEIRGWIKPA